jgi:2-alkenal reductase
VKGETSGAFVPTHRFRSVLSDVFKGEAPRRASFGVHYLDLDSAAVSGEAAPAEAGALLVPSRRVGAPAVAVGSAAAEAGLKEGDVILRLDNVDIAGERELTELLAGYDPGARVAVEYQRGNDRLRAEVTLD